MVMGVGGGQWVLGGGRKMSMGCNVHGETRIPNFHRLLTTIGEERRPENDGWGIASADEMCIAGQDGTGTRHILFW